MSSNDVCLNMYSEFNSEREITPFRLINNQTQPVRVRTQFLDLFVGLFFHEFVSLKWQKVCICIKGFISL